MRPQPLEANQHGDRRPLSASDEDRLEKRATEALRRDDNRAASNKGTQMSAILVRDQDIVDN